MTTKEHHLLCLGALANLYLKSKNFDQETWLDKDDLAVIEQAVESAEKELKMPVSLERLKNGCGIMTPR